MLRRERRTGGRLLPQVGYRARGEVVGLLPSLGAGGHLPQRGGQVGGNLAGQFSRREGGGQGLDAFVKRCLGEVVGGQLRGSIPAERFHPRAAFDLEGKLLPDLHAASCIAFDLGDLEQIGQGPGGHQVLCVLLDDARVGLLRFAQLSHFLVCPADIVLCQRGLRRVGPVVEHRLESVLDGRVAAADLHLAQAPLELGVRGAFAALVETEKLLVFREGRLPVLLLVVSLRNLKLVRSTSRSLGQRSRASPSMASAGQREATRHTARQNTA